MMSLYDDFETNGDEEINGVVVEPNETTRITIARAGGANKEYEKLLDKITKKNKHKIDMDKFTLSEDRAITIEIYAKCVIKHWDTKVEGQWVQDKIESREGLVPFCQKNVIETLTALPDLFKYLKAEANASSNFKKFIRESDEKN